MSVDDVDRVDDVEDGGASTTPPELYYAAFIDTAIGPGGYATFIDDASLEGPL